MTHKFRQGDRVYHARLYTRVMGTVLHYHYNFADYVVKWDGWPGQGLYNGDEIVRANDSNNILKAML